MSKEAMKLALEALEYIANETYDPWTNGAEAGRIAKTTLSKIKNKCRAIQTSDQMTCECGNVWDMNDPYPPKCTALREALNAPLAERQARSADTWVHATEWRGLTDEEKSELWCESTGRDCVNEDTHVFADAIEAKLKEKNT